MKNSFCHIWNSSLTSQGISLEFVFPFLHIVNHHPSVIWGVLKDHFAVLEFHTRNEDKCDYIKSSFSLSLARWNESLLNRQKRNRLWYIRATCVNKLTMITYIFFAINVSSWTAKWPKSNFFPGHIKANRNKKATLHLK